MKKYLMMGAVALTLMMTASCSKETNLYDPSAAAKQLSETYQNKFVESVGQPNENQTWGFEATAASRKTRANAFVEGDPFSTYETDALYKDAAPVTAMTYSDFLNQDKWRRADWGGALDQNAAMNGDAEILLPDGEHTIKFTGGTHDFYVTGNATLNVPDFINQARIYLLPGKTLTLNMNNYINALEIYVAANATLNYNYDKLYYQTGDAKIFNRGTLNLKRDNFEINQKAIVYNEGTITGNNITSKPGDGNPSFLYNYGDINLTGKFQLNSCANFLNEGTFTSAGETEITQGNSHVWWVNKGTYTTAAFKSAAWNGQCYNYCRLFVLGDASIQNGVFHQMDGSYAEFNHGIFCNLKFMMGSKSGINILNGSLWGRDGADFRGKYEIQGFEAADDDAKVYVRLGGENKVLDHKGSAFHVKGANLTLGYEQMTFYSTMYYFDGSWNGTVNNFADVSTEASLQAVKSENSTWNTHNVTKIITGDDFAATGFTLKPGECSATWNGETGGGDEAVGQETIREQGRIMCEDLGTIGDFDFNDVVFDAVIYEKDGEVTRTVITLLAAGGTLHLTVAGEEVHQLFGVKENEMVNTGLVVKEAVTFTAAEKYEHLIDIPIIVRKQEGANITNYQLTAEKGQAPQKICVPVGTQWADEFVSITKAYTQFVDWVAGEDPFDWQWIQSRVDKYVDLNLQNND